MQHLGDFPLFSYAYDSGLTATRSGKEENTMEKEVLVVGANWRLGRWSVEAFLDAGWKVRAFVRTGSSARVRSGVTVIEGDAFDAEAVAAASEGVAVIVNALNPPYERWPEEVPKITHSILSAAQASGATVILPGNVYNYGEGMPPVLREDTPHLPTTRKGRLREEMEEAYRGASAGGVQTIVLRAGDFIERRATGNWFDTYIANKVDEGIVTYPGPLDRVHAWAYLPDLARAMVGLAEVRDDLGAFETIGFGGFALTGQELIETMERTLGRSLKVKRFPWGMVRLMSAFSAPMREVVEMRHLWEVPHEIDGKELGRILPGFRPTTCVTAIHEALGG
jgi:nucleoside-diphosphate-sugar epimerase